MIGERIERFYSKRRATLLGVGPMSKNCVDVSIELANTYDIPLFLIASRRQIECREFGGGYVEKWSTEDFASYVSKRDQRGKTILARDHGGPWQNTFEVDQKFSLREAMASAKKSFKVDIESGFDMIHIDPSVTIHGPLKIDEVIERIFELYEFCWSTAKDLGREIIFEIGTEEQSGGGQSLDELEYTLSETQKFCRSNHLPLPKFVVVQTGTRTMEMRNVGTFDAPFRIRNEIPAEIQIPRILSLCSRFGIRMKEHNTDYLSKESLEWHPRLGIHAANVAPEFGVAESVAFVEVLRKADMRKELDAFVALSLGSGKWKKWMTPGTTATDVDRALISGHYVFATPEFRELKASAGKALRKTAEEFDDLLKSAVRASILRYLHAFRLTSH
jgi:hypothetical protein